MEHDTKDYGPEPFAINLEQDTLANTNFRTTRWTGSHIQMTLMSIPAGGEVGLERHGHIDQFIRIEQGVALVLMGDSPEDLSFEETVEDDWAFFIPAGKWHNVINVGDVDLKLYSIYSPAEHDHGTVHATFEDAEPAEHDHES